MVYCNMYSMVDCSIVYDNMACCNMVSLVQYDINIRILQAMIFGIPLVLGLRTRMRDPFVYVLKIRAPLLGGSWA